jgi:ABC-type transporter Mla subunit MlaD
MEKQVDKLAGMLQVMSAQIDAALHESNAPATTLVETAHAMGQATQTIAKSLFDFSGNPTRVFQDLMLLHDDMHARATKAATAIQFHDRLAQCLMHVSASLSLLSEFVADGGTNSGQDWDKLRERIRGLMSMDGERALLDTLTGVPEPPVAAKQRTEGESGNVELF